MTSQVRGAVRALRQKVAVCGRARVGFVHMPRNAIRKHRNRRRWLRDLAGGLGLLLLAHGLALLLSRPIWRQVLVALEEERLPFDLVVVDAGHGGGDPGAKGSGLLEKDVALDVALRVGRELEDRGVPHLLTRRADEAIEPGRRVGMANTHRNAVTVSIHCNHAGDSGAAGIETHYCGWKPEPVRNWFFVRLPDPEGGGAEADGDWRSHSELLAAEVQRSLVSATKAANRGTRKSDLAVIRDSHGAAVLVEIGFLSNAMEAALLGTDNYRDLLAEAIADGVEEYIRHLKARAHGDRVAGAAQPEEG